jgi:hypothetical protein
MGAKDFSKLIRDSKVRKDFLKALKGQVVGVDTSVVMHILFNHVLFAADFHLQ